MGEVFELENGDRGKNYPKPTDLTDDGVPWVNAGDLREGVCEVTTAKHITTAAFDKLSRGKFKGGDVLFCLRGSLGKFGQVRNGDFGAIASSLVIIKASSSLDSRYLSQWLNCRSCKNQIDEYAGGAAQPNLGAKDLGRFRFPLPSHEKKSTIVEHLELMEMRSRCSRPSTEPNSTTSRNSANPSLSRRLKENSLNQLRHERGANTAGPRSTQNSETRVVRHGRCADTP